MKELERIDKATIARLSSERDTAIRERDQAISLLRRIYFDHEPDSVFAADEFVATYAVDECVAGDARAFLSRLSAPASKEGGKR